MTTRLGRTRGRVAARAGELPVGHGLLTGLGQRDEGDGAGGRSRRWPAPTTPPGLSEVRTFGCGRGLREPAADEFGGAPRRGASRRATASS